MFNLRHVRSLVAVVECGGFHEASRRLQCSQPAVSQHVRKLEEAVEAVLVVRDRHRCRPTPEGEVFLPYARSLLKVSERARTVVKGRTLTIGASSNVGTYLLQPRVSAYRRSGGATVNLDLWIGQNPEVANKLERHEIDVAIMEWWDGRSGFIARLWRQEPLVVIVPPSHPWAALSAITKEQLFEAPLIGGEPGTGTGRVLRAAFGDAAADLRIGLQLGSTEAVKHAVKAGLGVSLVLAGTVVDEIRAGSLRALTMDGTPLMKDLFVIRHVGQPSGLPAARFEEHLLGEMPAG